MDGVQDRAWLEKSCSESAKYPENLVYHNTYAYNLRGYVTRLNEREESLFCAENDSRLDLWEYNDGRGGFRDSCITRNVDLRNNFSARGSFNRRDPNCRFIFVYAPHSRECLNTNRSMLTYAMTFHQVMPSFLEFLLPFGRQEHARDFYFSGFRHETRLDPLHKGLHIPELGRSGREIRMSYSLKTVERSDGQPNWPWSIRQTAVYHSFDIDTGISVWLIVKGNQLMQHRLAHVTKSSSFQNVNDFETPASSFASNLTIHTVICDWCGEDWRWYLNYLESAFHQKTRPSMAMDVDYLAKHLENHPKNIPQPTSISRMLPGKNALNYLPNLQAVIRERFNSSAAPPDISSTSAPQTQPQPTGPPPGRCVAQDVTFATNVPNTPDDFTFGDLQRLQYLEDKTNEVLLVLDSNISILGDLEQHYKEVRDSEHWPQKISDSCKADIIRFESQIASITNDLRMQKARTNTLLRMVADRKGLLDGILSYWNAEASKIMALKAQQSSENMEIMTRDMHIIAQKTENETVSMRIITLVTLFFLPATFISTIMSTPIVQFRQNDTGQTEKVVVGPAIELYMSITVPLTVAVFVIYWYVARQAQNKNKRQDAFGV